MIPPTAGLPRFHVKHADRAALGSASVHHSTPARLPHMRLDANDASRQADVRAIQAPRGQPSTPSGMTARRRSRSLRCAVRPASSSREEEADRALRSGCPADRRGTQGTGRPSRRSSTSERFQDNASWRIQDRIRDEDTNAARPAATAVRETPLSDRDIFGLATNTRDRCRRAVSEFECHRPRLERAREVHSPEAQHSFSPRPAPRQGLTGRAASAAA